MKRLIAISLVVSLMACGGGGGGDDAKEPSFVGVWDATVSITKDECGIGDGGGSTITDTFTISQSGTNVSLTNTDGTTFSGFVDSDDSFTVSATQLDEASGCSAAGTNRFFNLDGDDADVSFTLDILCPNRNPCRVEYHSGHGTRR